MSARRGGVREVVTNDVKRGTARNKRPICNMYVPNNIAQVASGTNQRREKKDGDPQGHPRSRLYRCSTLCISHASKTTGNSWADGREDRHWFRIYGGLEVGDRLSDLVVSPLRIEFVPHDR